MPVITVIGGKLQGVECLYLAQKAGFDTILIDRRENPPGRGLCARFAMGDIQAPNHDVISALNSADMVIPAFEDDAALADLRALTAKMNLNVAFDFDAYAISSSKLESNALMRRAGVAMPGEGRPFCAPYIAKPSVSSGSQGVTYLADEPAFEAFKRSAPDWESWVIQPYTPGRQFSIEIIGVPGNYKTYEVTELYMDEFFDCKRVTAPCGIPSGMKAALAEIARMLAEAIGLRGIMDVEAIDDGGEWRILEIDARMPSQTPAAVLHATGVNLLAELAAVFGVGEGARETGGRHSCYEHIVVKDGKIRTSGEHELSGCGPLELRPGAFGADDALVFDGGGKLVATLINSADDAPTLEEKRSMVRDAIDREFGGGLAYEDAGPLGL